MHLMKFELQVPSFLPGDFVGNRAISHWVFKL